MEENLNKYQALESKQNLKTSMLKIKLLNRIIKRQNYNNNMEYVRGFQGKPQVCFFFFF